MFGRSETALAELSLGRRDRASLLAQAELEMATPWRAETVGRALHVWVSWIRRGGLLLLEEAVNALDSSP